MTSSSIDRLPRDVQAALAVDMTIDITTNGRLSGELRRIEIWFLNIDGLIYITGTPGPRDWFANLLADPSLIFHLKETTTADLPAQATAVTDPDERSQVFAASSASWYLHQGDSLDSLLNDAPMVRLRFDG
jgi:hypothetical protein